MLLFYSLLISTLSFSQVTDLKNYSINQGLPNSNVVDAAQDTQGYLWFATQGGGIAQFDGITFKVFNEENGLQSNFINSLLTKKDSLFIGTNEGMSIYNNQAFRHFKSPKVNKLTSIKDKLYLATEKGIYQFKKNYTIPLQINIKIDNSNISNISYWNAHYWIETTTDAWKVNALKNPTSIVRVSKNELSQIFKYQPNFKVPNSLKNITNKVFRDRQNNHWILTSRNGIYKSMVNSFVHYSNIENYNVGEIKSIHLLNTNLLFTDGNAIYKKDSISFQLFNSQKLPFKATSIASDKSDNLWLGSENKGVFIYRKQVDSTYSVENFNTENGLPSNQIQHIIINENHIWLTTKNSGILKLDYDFENNSISNIHRFNRSNGLKDTQITNTIFHDNKIWYTTKNGALGYIENNSVVQYANILKQQSTITALAFTKNNVFLGTQGKGLWKVSTENLNSSPKRIDRSYLTSQNIRQLLIDENNLWVGTDRGLDKLSLQNNKIIKSTHYNANDGFTNVETSFVAIKDSQNTLWFGTNSGIAKYIPTENKVNITKPTINIEEIRIGLLNLDSLALVKIKDVYQLKPSQNNVSIQFKTIDFNYPERIQYQWELNGVKSKWSTNNTLNFANLQSGNYTLKVRSKISHNQMSNPKTFSFFIDKPLFEKAWFLWGISIAGLFIILSFTSLYVSGIKKKNKEKIDKLTLEKELNSLEQKALQLQMNPHFIFNVLNDIKALGNKGKSEELNSTISKFAGLLRSVLQNSRKKEISLSEEIQAITHYLDLEKQLSSNPFSYTIKTDTNTIDLEEILIPPMMIQPFIENSIKHGFKGNDKENKVTISFKINGSNLSCSITDTGIGFVQSQRLKTNTNHKSVALQVTKERIKNLSKYSYIEIKELTENNLVLGTKVEFQIPLKTDY